MSREQRKRKRAPQLSFYKAPHLEGTNIINHNYLQYSAGTSGKVSLRTATIKTAAPPLDSDILPDHDTYNEPFFCREDDLILPTDPPLDAGYLEFLETEASGEKAKRVRAKGDESLHDFIPQSDAFLQELIGLESRGSWPTNSCATCHVEPGEYQCTDCWGRLMMCQGCLVQSHVNLYLHRIQRWNGAFFEKHVTLKGLGIRNQLGHRPGEICHNPQSCPNDDFVILHSNGQHEVGIDFCGCGKGNQLHSIQLLRAGLFPATVTNPKTAATTRVLDLFEILSYESKASCFEFYHALCRLTNNTGINPPKDRYPSFLRMAHEWRHLNMMKRAGRGHDSTGIAGTQEGECAVLCPACPQPGINMSPDWEERSPHLRFLDTLFIAFDANFRLRRKNVSSHEADPGLSKGYAYFVEEVQYKDFLKEHIDEVEPKTTCSRHDAINLAETKPGQGNAATGVGACTCARHDMKRPNGVAQLQRGERYCNMDYIFFQTMRNNKVLSVVISYDIACQWSINILKRMAAFDENFFLFREDSKIKYLVPKFHLPAHVSRCRTRFSFNLTKNVGRTDGEAPERGWATVNALAPSTKEMGPGSCRDTIDYHFGDDNHKKVIGMGKTLLRKIMAAARDMAEHVIGHDELEATLPAETLAEWTAEIEEWEADPSQPNPFERISSGPSTMAVRRNLAEEEKRQLDQGRDFALDERVTPSVLISLGMDLEGEQRTHRVLVSKIWDHSLDRQHTKLLLRGNTLIRKIESWIKFQQLYIPGVARLRETSLRHVSHSTDLKAHELPLWLPSQIGSQITVSKELRHIEFELRLAQAREALDDLRAQLQLRAHVFKFKDRFVRGQGANTRARQTLEGVQSKVDAAAGEYRASYNALSTLGKLLEETSWTTEFRPLLAEDVRDLSERKEKQSEGKRDISWIWRSGALNRIDKADEGHFREGVRIEWAKSRARAHRFTEEVSLLTEEMMRVQRFFNWKASQWEMKSKASMWPEISLMQAEGLKAYATRQAAMYRALGMHFMMLWKDVPAHIARMQTIIEDPSLAKPGEFDSTKGTYSKPVKPTRVD